MDEQMTMMVLEAMAQMSEALVARIESLERRLDEVHQCSCKKWVNELRSGAIFEPCTLGDDLTQDGGISEIMPQG